MNLRPRQPATPEINLTPLIDAVFLLLIFFMVSTTFEKETRIEVELPEADTVVDERQPEDRLEIVIDRKGHYFVNDAEVLDDTPATLREAISQQAGGRADIPVSIKADGQAPYQAVVTSMDVLTQLGLTRMSFAAVRPPEGQ